MRVNINFTLDDASCQSIRDINSKIKELSAVNIDYGLPGIRPHMTLAMGEIEEENLGKFKQILERTNITSSGKRVRLGRPFMVGGYVLQNVLRCDQASLYEDFKNLTSGLGSILELNPHAMSEKHPPHITLAFVLDPKPVKNYIKSIRGLTSVYLEKPTLSKAGLHGVVYEEKL